MNEETPSPDKPAEAPSTPSAETPQAETPQPETRGQDSRRRLRELLAIPDRDRTDAIWDEIVDLEIELAPGNRAVSPQQDMGLGRHQDPNRRQDQGRRPDQQGRRQGQQPGGGKQGKRSGQRHGRGPKPGGAPQR